MAAFAIGSGYNEIRDFVGDDYVLTVTVAGSGSLAGWSLTGHLWTPTGVEIAGAVVVTITDAANRIFTATVAGQNLSATTYYSSYHFSVVRTDTGSRTVVAWGPLSLTDPSLAGPPG